MTSNGETDQAAMVQETAQRMSQSTSQKSRALAHASSYKQQVTAPWYEVLQREQIGLNDNFFEVGDGSIQIVLLHHRIGEVFKITIPIAELFRLTTVKRIADYLQAMQDNVRTMNQTQQRDAFRSHA